jgi:hypothetical protein
MDATQGCHVLFKGRKSAKRTPSSRLFFVVSLAMISSMASCADSVENLLLAIRRPKSRTFDKPDAGAASTISDMSGVDGKQRTMSDTLLKRCKQAALLA